VESKVAGQFCGVHSRVMDCHTEFLKSLPRVYKKMKVFEDYVAECIAFLHRVWLFIRFSAPSDGNPTWQFGTMNGL
jgi:hypothetical protein